MPSFFFAAEKVRGDAARSCWRRPKAAKTSVGTKGGPPFPSVDRERFSVELTPHGVVPLSI